MKLSRNQKILLGVVILIILVIIVYFIYRATKKSNPTSEKFSFSEPMMVLFHSNTCGHCIQFMPTWQGFKTTLGVADTKMVEIEASNQELMAQANIKYLPTVRFYSNGLNDINNFKEYTGDRTFESLKQFYDENRAT